ALAKEFPNSPTVLNLLAAQHLSRRQLDAARASHAKAAQISPNDLEAVAGLVPIDLQSGRAQDAINRVEAGLKQANPSPAFHVLAARTFIVTRNPARGEEVLKRAIEAYPSRLEAYGVLGQLYIRQDRLLDAVDQF